MEINKPNRIIVHCSDISEKVAYDQFNSINAYHRDERGFPKSSLGLYIGYHVLITGGKNYKCKEDIDIGAHCNQTINGLTINLQSLGICWGGDGDVEYPSSEHYRLLQAQIWAWQDKYNIPNDRVEFHRKWATAKTCPGSLLNNEWLKQLLTRPIINLNPQTTVIPTKVDSCTVEKGIIKDKDLQISRLQSLIALLTKIWNKI